MPKTLEPLVNNPQAAKTLGCSQAYLSAVKRAMGISYAHFFFLSEVHKFLRQHPDFRIRQVYKRGVYQPGGSRLKLTRQPKTSPPQQLINEASGDVPSNGSVPPNSAKESGTAGAEVCETSPPSETPVVSENKTWRAPATRPSRTHVSQALFALMERQRISSKELSRRSESRGYRRFPSSYLSRILNGVQTYVAQADLDAFAHLLSASPRDHFDLCRARLEDECPAVFRDRIEILCTLDLPGHDRAYPFARLSPQGREVMRAWLKRKPSEWEGLLEALVRCMPVPREAMEVKHFATSLVYYMDQNQISGKEVSRRTGAAGRRMPSSWLTRITTGQQTWLEAEALVLLVQTVTGNPVQQAELVRSYLYDELPPFAYSLVRVGVKGEDRTDEELLARLSLRGRVLLLQWLHHAPQPEATLIELARFAGLDLNN